MTLIIALLLNGIYAHLTDGPLISNVLITLVWVLHVLFYAVTRKRKYDVNVNTLSWPFNKTEEVKRQTH